MNTRAQAEAGGAHCGFRGTRWSVILAARDRKSPAADEALSELCRTYWYPLYAFVRRSGLGHHEAEDVTQGFFHRLLTKDGLANVDPGKGKFRSFLLSAMKHFLANERVRAHAWKRGGKHTFLSIDMASGEGRYEWEPVDTLTPEALYERSWALTLLDDALRDLAGEYAAKGREELFDCLRTFMSGPDPDMPYAEAGRALGLSEGNVKVSVHRLRRRFAEILRARVAHTVETDADIDAEIRRLMHCFAR